MIKEMENFLANDHYYDRAFIVCVLLPYSEVLSPVVLVNYRVID